MRIAFDIMGGDYAPTEAIKGVQLFFDENHDETVHLMLLGTPEAAALCHKDLAAYKGRFTCVEAPQVIGMSDNPTKAFKEKQQSSMAMGFGMLQAKKADAFISAGNTGAMMVGAMYSVKAIPGIIRPTIASPVPCDGGINFNLLLDVGLNADCKVEHLAQFAQLGSMYAKYVYNIDEPRVGLLNVGEEEGKGNLLSQAAFPVLKANKNINFVGNIEGRDVFLDKAHVIVCEGFLGNIILKMVESLYNRLYVERNIKDSFLEWFNHERYGGTPILGINDTVIIGHGIAHALAFKNMIEVARKNVEVDLPGKFKSYFASAIESQA